MSNEPSSGNILVKVFADLRQYQQPETSYQAENPVPISLILSELSIPPEKVTIIFVNGRHADPEDRVKPGDTLSFFPPVGGG